MGEAQFDYVIVGGGTAGCVLANRLSADGHHKVLLLEAGPSDRSPWIHLPIGYGKTMFHKTLNWGFYTEPEPTMKNRRIYWPRGRTLGGSSSINGLIFVRGQSADYDHWAQLGNRGWSWDDVLPYFIRSEHNSKGASATHGGDGPLWCSDIEAKHELVETIIKGAEELGVKRSHDFNSGESDGVGYYQLFTPKRSSLQYGRGLPSSRQRSSQPPGRGRCAGDHHHHGWQAGGRRALSSWRCPTNCPSTRSRAYGRCLTEPAASSAIGYRSVRPPRSSWHRCRARSARCRREPAGPPAGPPDVQGSQADHY